jgi:hypothetical protein
VDDLISTLLLPTERPPIAVDVKRALLTFDQVNMSSADDRELIDPASFLAAISPIPMPIAFGGGEGPVLPLGKLPRYDEVFEQTLSECDAAVRQGSVVIRASPKIMTTGFMLGAIPNPEGWAPPQWVMNMFRLLVSQREVLLSACRGLPTEQHLRQLDLGALAPGGLALTSGFGGPPSVADVNDGSLHPDVALAVQRLAAARLGVAIKYVGLCEVTGLHPTSSDVGMVSLIEHFQKTSASSVASILETHSERDLVRRVMRVERIVFSHDLPDALLDGLSIEDVLKLRTAAWGRAASARTAFFAAVRRLADECPTDSEFDRAVRDSITSYSTERADLADEWKKLGVKVGVPVLTGALTASGNILQSILGIPSWSVAVVVTAAGAALTGVSDQLIDLFRQRKDLAASPGKALVTPYAFALRS